MNAQQLKNSILQEAIEGRLVPQDPNDEPASVLLDKIRKEKARLVMEGKLKKKDLEETPVSEDEIPFEIPESWKWCRVGDISESYIGLTYKPSDVSNKGWIVLRSSNIQDGNLDFCDIVKVDVDVPDKLHVRQNDIIICARNGSKKLVGKSALVKEVTEPTTFGAFMAICRTTFYRYVSMYLLSPLFFGQLRKESDTTTINQLTQKNFNKYLVPLPPLEEQHSIVAKIEELLPKVEAYGKAQEKLNKLNEELPERLKKSILQEAIEGRLVPQDPNDEPASVLLDKIRAEKKRLVKEGKLKKKDLEETPINEDEIPFEIPESWEWHRIGFIANLFTGNSISKDVKEKKYMNVKGRWYIATKDVNFDNTIDYDNGVYIPVSDEPKFKIANAGSILMCIEGGSAGRKIGIIDRDVCFGNKLCCFNSYVIYNVFLYYYLQSSIFKEIFNDNKKGIIGGVSINMMAPLLIPLPPLAEQQRIVAKIEEVFKEIDKMKTK